MKKKLLYAISLMLALVVTITSCNSTQAPHCTHTYTESVHNEPTCYENGDKLFTCSKCGYYYINYDAIPATGHNYLTEPTCSAPRYCTLCGYSDYFSRLDHDWVGAHKTCSRCGKAQCDTLGGHDFTNTTDGTCTRCGYGVKFILPTFPTHRAVVSYDEIRYKYTIENIKIERKQRYSSDPIRYLITFVVESTYHKYGDNYNDTIYIHWKMYDEDGFVVEAGAAAPEGSIMVGEKARATDLIFVGGNEPIQDGKTYRLVLTDPVD